MYLCAISFTNKNKKTMLDIPSTAPCQDQLFAKLAFSAAVRIANDRDMNAEDIFHNLPHFGGSGSMWQLQTDDDNWTEKEFPNGYLIGSSAVKGIFEYEGKYYYFVYQD